MTRDSVLVRFYEHSKIQLSFVVLSALITISESVYSQTTGRESVQRDSAVLVISEDTVRTVDDTLLAVAASASDTQFIAGETKAALVQKTESFLSALLGLVSDKMSPNGELQSLVMLAADSASKSTRALASTSPGGPFMMFPFANLSAIPTNPNFTFFLIKGPLVDFTQTHTLLPGYKVSVTLDSEATTYEFRDSYGSRASPIKQATLVNRQEYLSYNLDNEIRNLFTKTVVTTLSAKEELRSGAVRLFSASVTTNETFQKIFGGDEVAVEASGNINLNVSVAREKTSNVNTTTGRNSSVTPKFEQTQQFNLRGTIGKKVEILIDQDSEREFDFENNIKLTYTGYDDEILQKLEAGNIDLSLPGTQLVTASAQNKGLFGVKALFKIGDLNFTTIASIQRGEKDKVSFNSSDGVTTTLTKVVYDYAKAKFFFLGELYRENFENYANRIPVQVPAGNQISTLYVYKRVPSNTQQSTVVQGRAIVNDVVLLQPGSFNLSDDEIWRLDSIASGSKSRVRTTTDNYVPLYASTDQEEKDYRFDPTLGILSLTVPLQEDERLAVWYTTRDGTKYGELGQKNGQDYVQLKMLWLEGNSKANHPTWNLELKNVYDFGGITREDLKSLTIIYKSPTAAANAYRLTIPDSRGESKSVLQILHLDEVQEGTTGQTSVIDDAIISRAGFPPGVLVFPRLRPFDPDTTDPLDGGFAEERYPTTVDGDSVRFPKIYDLDRTNTLETDFSRDSAFIIQVSTKQKTSTIRLPTINILEGSEEVLLNGQPLEKDVGYHIDYFSGTVELLDRRATLPDANIEIRYESAQLFSFEKKSLFGARAEYSLADWGLGANSFVGTTALFHSQSTINKRVQLGEEPFTNFVWDVNAQLEFGARYLTRFANFLPLVSTNQPSRITLKGEYARLFPSPNTSNGLLKKDENGVAYVDDFEAIKRTFPLGTIRRSWSLASTPLERDASDRGKTVWYQAQNNREDISLIKTEQTELVTTMGIAFKPKRDSTGSLMNSWGGLMRGFSRSTQRELADTRFVEFWIKNYTHSGYLHVELGAITEDQNGSQGRLNTEIQAITNQYITEAQDVGLDGRNDNQEEAVLVDLGIPPNSSLESLTAQQKASLDSLQALNPWGLINIGRNAGEDPFGDNWDRTLLNAREEELQNAILTNLASIKLNGLENNLEDGSVKIGDSEDLDNDGSLDDVDAYFRYTIPLTPSLIDSSLIAGITDAGWTLLRIPVTRPDTSFGEANLANNFGNVRFWLSPSNPNDTLIHIRIAEPQFVSSQWLFPADNLNGLILPPNGKQIDPAKRDRIVEISSINTEESIEYAANQPPGLKNEYVSGQSGASKRRVREQSLVLRLNELPARARAIIWKKADLGANVLNYARMRMFVHGDVQPSGALRLPTESENTDQSPLRFFLRFGSNQFNYYEIEQPVFADWAISRNSIDIDFKELTSKKFDVSVDVDTVTGIRSFDLGQGKILRIKGSPSLSNIVDIYIGAVNTDNLFPYSGDIWFNELRLSEVNDRPGDAALANINIAIADLATLSANADYRSADFRTVSEPIRAGSSTNQNLGLSGSINLHKFYVERWGINLPVSFNVTRSQADPKYVADVLASAAKRQNRINLVDLRIEFDEVIDSLELARLSGADTSYINKLMRDSVSVRDELQIAENFESSLRTVRTSRGFNISFSRTKSEQSYWLLRYTIDNVSTNYSYNISEETSPSFIKNKNQSWSSATTYSLPFPKRSFRPFAWFPLASAPYIGSLFRSIKETDFNYILVTTVATDFSISSNRSTIVERDPKGHPIVKPTARSLTSSRGYNLSIGPMPSLTSSIGVKYQSDLRGLSHKEILKGVLSGLNPFDGFDDFSFDSPIDTIVRRDRLDSLFLVFNRDFSTNNNFNVSYTPTTFGFLTHSIGYGAVHSSSRQRPPTTIYYHNSQLSRRVQIDGGFKLKEFIGIVTGAGDSRQTTRRGGSEDTKRTRRDRSKTETIETKKTEADTSKSKKHTAGLLAGRLKGLGSKILASVNDIRSNVSLENTNQISGIGSEPTAAYRWFGYSTTRRNGFLSNLFSWDLGTVRQFDSSDIDTSTGSSRIAYQYLTARNLTYGLGYGLNFGLMVIDLKYDYTERRGVGQNLIESRSITRSRPFPWLKPLPLIFDVTIRLNNLGKWPLLGVVSGFTNSMNFSFTFNEKETQTIEELSSADSSAVRTFRDGGRLFLVKSITTARTFPQMNLDIVWKGNVSQNISFNNTDNESRQLTNVLVSNSKTVSSTLSYSKRGGFRLPLWFLKKKQLDNEVRIAATFNYSKRLGYTYFGQSTTSNEVRKEKTNDEQSWSVEPRIDYSFTSRLTGGIFIKYENNKNFRTGTTTRFLGGLTINISIGT